jgi:hypothetical protein
MFVIRSRGRTIVLTGWRAWLAGAATFIVIWLVLGLLAFLMLGLAVTVGVALLLIVPAIIIGTLVQSWMGRHR